MLSYKEQLKTSERNKLAALNARRSEIENKIAELHAENTALCNQLNDSAKSGISAQKLSEYNFRIDNNRKFIKQLEKDLVNARLSVEVQLKAVVRTTQEVEGMLKLKEKQHEEFLMEEKKEDERVVSEFVSSKLVRESKNDGI